METQRVSIETAGKGSDKTSAHQTQILFPGVHVKRHPIERRWKGIISRVKKIKTLKGNDFFTWLTNVKSLGNYFLKYFVYFYFWRKEQF